MAASTACLKLRKSVPSRVGSGPRPRPRLAARRRPAGRHSGRTRLFPAPGPGHRAAGGGRRRTGGSSPAVWSVRSLSGLPASRRYRARPSMPSRAVRAAWLGVLRAAVKIRAVSSVSAGSTHCTLGKNPCTWSAHRPPQSSPPAVSPMRQRQAVPLGAIARDVARTVQNRPQTAAGVVSGGSPAAAVRPTRSVSSTLTTSAGGKSTNQPATAARVWSLQAAGKRRCRQ